MANPLLPGPERGAVAALPRPLRVALSLDAASADFSALEAAVEIAAALRAELQGVLFEDADLLRCAQLPFTREIGHASALERDFAPDRLLRGLRAVARALEARLAEAARQADVRWSLRVESERSSPAGFPAAEPWDLLVVGRQRAAPGPASPRRGESGRRQLVLHESLLATARITELLGTLRGGAPADVFVLPDTGAVALPDERLSALRALDVAIYRLAPMPDPHRMLAQLTALRLKPAWCLLPPGYAPTDFETIARALACPLLIVRTGA